ncbi:MAG: cysteine peptidase family C39 domain-containing protein [Candidatus Eisenbacteria bacterium]|nr:cysteine peptidase family C39 domain-containing protein [Candidatus Eisenbacteria bacterium]
MWFAATACLAVAASAFQAVVALATPAANENVRLLDVPYVSQSEALCGGAALAMILRYWGESSVLAEDFAHLLEPGSAGIRTDGLVSAVRSRGWTALPVTGDRSIVRSHLAEGRPMILLVGQGSGAQHYVVVVAWANGSVILHDPAIGPHRVLRESEFAASWARSERWALLILPPEPLTIPDASESSTTTPQKNIGDVGCDTIVDAGVRQALAGDAAGAELTLLAAEALCPLSAAPLRELAGLRFTAEDWIGAARVAERALALDQEDSHTWRLLAGSRFLSGDIEGALDAWNRVSEPRMDLAHMDGLVRTRYRVVADQLDLSPRQMITPGAFRRARRRLSEFPAHSESRLGLKPLPGGIARVNVAVFERPLLFNGPLDAGGMALRSIVDRQVSIDVASPSGQGELWTVQYRWWRERPRFLLALAVPAVGGRPGIWRVEGTWERQSYAIVEPDADGGSTGSGAVREERRRTSLSFSDWIGPDLRLETSAALDKWADRGSFLSVGATLEARGAGDRLAMRAEGAGWVSPGGGRPFQAGSLLVGWGPKASNRGGWLARLGIQGVSFNCPLALWPGAGTGHARAPLLRAHPLLEDGVLNGRVFGRALVHGGLEKQEWPWILGPLRLGWAAFIDGAKPWDTLTSDRIPWQLDAGVGLRLAGIGRHGQLRLDVARGFEDGESAVSVAWEPR